MDDAQADLGSGWGSYRGNVSLEWERAKHASRDIGHRVSSAAERALPRDSDRGGR